MTAPKGEPILIDCEGGDLPGNVIDVDVRGCQMCGQNFYLHPSGKIPPHQRDDTLARLRRGDFG